jgi:predicted ATPase/DNA-binding CsgD family transcriptional regulator
MQDNSIVFPEPPAGDTARLVTQTLPVSLTSLIGREHEVQSIHALLLRPAVRLLTLTGTPGVGKTRLALEVARDLVHDFADGVRVVSLAPLSDPAYVIPTIAHSLGLTESGSQPLLDLLKISQRNKQRLLLLDNFEHVITAATLLVELLEACPAVKLLVTSREVLRLRAEHQFTVPPLELPDPSRLPDDRSLAHVPAVNLFIQRAQAIKSDFQVTTDNAMTIAEICTRLDGLPLAIELAAARIKLLPPQALLARLGQRLVVLTGGVRDAPARQQTLRNTIAWSYQLLDAREQRLFRRLSVFVGGCTLEAAEVVCGTLSDSEEAGPILDSIASLLDKSLLKQTEQDDEPRLLMLETVREYGLESLASSGELELTRQAHAAYYLQLSEQAEPQLRGPQQALWFNRLEAEHDNCRAALGWALEKGERELGLRLVGALWEFWLVRGHFTEGQGWLERVLERSRDAAPALQAKAFTGAGSLAWAQDNYQQEQQRHQQALALYREVGDKQGIAFSLLNLGDHALGQGPYEQARPLLEESLALYRELGDQWGIAMVLNNLGLEKWSQGDHEGARVLFEESLALSREVQDEIRIAVALHNLGNLARYQGDYQRARDYLEKCLSMSEKLGNKQLMAMTLNNLGLLARGQGDLARAAGLHRESFALSRELGFKLCMALNLQGLAGVDGMQKNPQRAARLLGAAEAMREAINAPLQPDERTDYDHIVGTIRAQLDEAAFAVAWAQGRSMTPEQALASPTQETMPQAAPASQPPTSPKKSTPTYPEGLTARELEVLCLLAQGLTSAQIAKQLIIGVVTVNFHVRSIYSKLGVTSRSAATRYALEHHLL